MFGTTTFGGPFDEGVPTRTLTFSGGREVGVLSKMTVFRFNRENPFADIGRERGKIMNGGTLEREMNDSEASDDRFDQEGSHRTLFDSKTFELSGRE
jgi:hypothetical protein